MAQREAAEARLAGNCAVNVTAGAWSAEGRRQDEEESWQGAPAGAQAEDAELGTLRAVLKCISDSFDMIGSLARDLWRALQLGLTFVPCAATAGPAYALGGAAWARWQRLLVATLEAAGPTFIKLGQWASTRPDVFPPDLCAVLGKLHDDVDPHSVEETRRVLREELGERAEPLLATLETRPLGTGCIAQVHAAELPGGAGTRPRRVAVKVQHPGVERRFRQDLRLMHLGVRLVTAVAPSTKWFALAEMARHFEEFLLSQLDFGEEADHLARFARNFAGDDAVCFPEPERSLCTKRVLVESLERGASVREFLGCDAATRAAIAEIGLRLFLQMVLVDNFTHADLHPGNMLVRFVGEDGRLADSAAALAEMGPARARPQVVLVDAGLVSHLDGEHRRNFVDLFAAVARGDGRLAATLMLTRSSGHECEEPEAFIDEVSAIVGDVSSTAFRLQSVEIGDVLQRMLSAARRHKVLLDPSFTKLIVGIVTLEGVGRQLDASIDIFSAALPMLSRTDSRTRKAAVGAAAVRAARQAST